MEPQSILDLTQFIAPYLLEWEEGQAPKEGH